MILENKTLKPDPRKGLLRIVRSEEGLVHVQWLERTPTGTSATPEVDVIVFPEECDFEQVGNQRVYLLKFPNERDRDMFFWMQEPHASVDAALATRFNSILDGDHMMDAPSAESGDVVSSSAIERATESNAPAAGMSLPSGGTVGLVPSAPAQEPMMAGIHAHTAAPASELAAVLSQAMSSMVTPAQPPAASNLSDTLAAALMGALQQTGGNGRAMVAAAGPSLEQILKPEVLMPLLQDPEVVERLSVYLPEAHRNSRDALAALLRSPQFTQQLHSFSSALASGQLDLAQFGLRAEGFSAADFLQAIQELVDREAREQSGGGPAPMDQ